MNRRSGLTSLFVILFASVVIVAVDYRQLPDPMASHFDFGGEPDAWMSKPMFFIVIGTVHFGLAALLVGLACRIGFLPNSMINLPRREYWLAPERRAATLERVEGGLIWVAVVTAALLLVILQLTIRANLEDTGLPGTPTIATIVLYVAALVAVLVRTFAPFFRAP